MSNKRFIIEQLDKKLKPYAGLAHLIMPSKGWIHAIRNSLGISLEQLSRKLGKTKQSVQQYEKREQDGSITIKTLQEAAAAMEMQLVYVFLPKDGSLDALVEKKAKQMAVYIVKRSTQTMALEDQGPTSEYVKDAILEKTTLLKNEMPKILWD